MILCLPALLGFPAFAQKPAATMVYYGVKNWQMGVTLTQNWSIAGVGKSEREDVSEFTAHPILNYLMGPWYIGMGDFTYSYNWKGNQGWTIPLRFQVGHVSKIGSMQKIVFRHEQAGLSTARVPS